MKLNNVSLPHPVIGLRGINNTNSDENDVEGLFKVERCSISTGGDKLDVNVVYSLIGSPQLAQLITEGKVEFACECACAKTAFRNVYRGGSDLRFSVDVDALRDQVLFHHYLVAVRPFVYSDEACWHPDYAGCSFDLKPGVVLGYAGETKHMVERESAGDTSGSSLFAVECGDEKSGPFQVDVNADALTIFLPKKVYVPFSNLYENRPDYAVHFHASLVVPALMHALSIMASDSKDTYQDKRWFQAIETVMANDKNLRDIELSNSNMLKVAQSLVGCPFGELTETMMSSVSDQNED
jgi:hypothetical protein